MYQVECPENIVDLHTTMNTEKELVENTKSHPCLYKIHTLVGLRLEGVLCIGVVAEACYENDKEITVTLYTQDPLDPTEFYENISKTKIRIEDCLGLIENFEKTTIDNIRISEVVFSEYVDAQRKKTMSVI